MNDLWVMAGGAGLRDGLNPCMLMTCAVFIAYGLWFKRSVFFAFSYLLGILIFNFGPAQILVFQKNFIFAAKIIYFVLGVWAFILGVVFFKDWFLMSRGLGGENPVDEKKPLLRSNFIMTVILSVALSALATLWPINNYMMLLGNEAALHGQWSRVMPLLLSYVFISMWPLWFVWAFLSIKNVRVSLMKIVGAAIFFATSLSGILIFK